MIIMSTSQVYKNGYSGGRGGVEFIDAAFPPNSRVYEVQIRSGAFIDSIQIIHKTPQGVEHAFPKHGGEGGTLNIFTLGDNEHIIAISGRYGEFIDSLRIHTDLPRSSPTYGGPGGEADFNYEAPDGTEIAGFYGRAGDLIDAIGVVLRRK